ncbi:hypothetical protein NL676_001902 [Syzygium grande]|nr:hypothetical protein NL676_001902 [Syzygium grande]
MARAKLTMAGELEVAQIWAPVGAHGAHALAFPVCGRAWGASPATSRLLAAPRGGASKGFWQRSTRRSALLDKADNLGTISLGILHVSFTSFSSVASLAIRSLGPKNAILLGTTGYTMVPACLYLGFAASIIWVGQGTYLTSTARIHAKDRSLHEGTSIGAFNGEFWGMFASHQVVGNLVSLAVLREETDGSASGTKLLFIVFLCSMTFGTILMCFLRKRDSREERASPEYPASFHSSLVSLSKSVITPLFDVRMLLIILLIAYSGLQQAFVWYFTFFSGLVGLLSIALYVNK